MEIHICDDKDDLGRRAAKAGATRVREAIAHRGEANIIVATGASQFEMLAALVEEPDIDWSVVTGFHLDEYVGLPLSHPASFRAYLRDRFVERLPSRLKAFHYLDAETDPQGECARVGAILREHPVDVAFIGIGENGHIAFNDPPADFETEEPYLVVDLDDACRQQQLGEGWFATFHDVPEQAVSMSVKQILKSESIVCSVPDERKAEAVRGSVEGAVSPDCPGTALQTHGACELFLDPPSAGKLAG